MKVKVVFSVGQRLILIKKTKHISGQSTIEFIMTFSAAVGFVFLFLKMAMNFTDGYMVHHATYMSARSYLVDDQERDSIDEGDQRAEAKAKLVFTSYLPDGLINGVDSSSLKFNTPNPGITKFRAFVGVFIRYTQRFSIGFIGGKAPLEFVSEAFLGREPTRVESKDQTCNAIKLAGLSNCNVHVTLEDNGG